MGAGNETNRLTGNGGSDGFNWQTMSDLGVGATADVITDFQHTVDRIGLGNIDADRTTPEHQRFTFVDAAAFSGTAGELRYQVQGNSLRLEGDTDGNAVADFEIVLENISYITAYDLNL